VRFESPSDVCGFDVPCINLGIFGSFLFNGVGCHLCSAVCA